MNIYVIGKPRSGRTTVANNLVRNFHDQNRFDWYYVNTLDFIKDYYINKGENFLKYTEEYHTYLLNKLKDNPDFIIENLSKHAAGVDNSNLVVDGIVNPRDFCKVFDYNKDIVVFLNRIDNDSDMKDYESIGISVIRDYCFWLASANLLSKSRWIEYNFKMINDDSDLVRELGSKNSIYIVKSIGKVIDHLIKLVGNVK